MKALISAWVLSVGTVVGMGSSLQAGTVTFGSGMNSFQMEFVTIGNPGNAPDTSEPSKPSGAVGYTYGIGKFEVTEDMITKYNVLNSSLQISMNSRGANKPATSVSWNEAARFANWLNISTGNQAAYKFTTSGVNDNIELWVEGEAGYDAANPYRNSLAKYFLPSHNEWYKAAFYNASDSTYFKFTTGSNTVPIPIASGTAEYTAVYDQPLGQGPADVDQAGGLSPYGVMALGGNAFEWDESPVFVSIGSPTSVRGVRGGSWHFGTVYLPSSVRVNFAPQVESVVLGFRVATMAPSTPPVPEPSMMLIGTLFGLGGLVARRRMNR